MISFEEFHATQKRQRARVHAEEHQHIKIDKDMSNTLSEKEALSSKELWFDKPSSNLYYRTTIGRFIERYEVQLVIVILIYFDLIASILSLLIVVESKGTNNKVEGGFIFLSTKLFHVINIFKGFTLIIFSLEIMSLITTFGLIFFSHFGYCLDLLVVLTCVMSEIYDDFETVRLLGFIRVWRLARLVSTALDTAHTDHTVTKLSLKDAEEQTKRMQTQIFHLIELKQKETDLRKSNEKMVQSYKDEVETLGEALKVAAYDVAKVAKGDFFDERKHKEQSTNFINIDNDGDDFF